MGQSVGGNPINQTIDLVPTDFGPYPLSYPAQTSVNFTAGALAGFSCTGGFQLGATVNAYSYPVGDQFLGTTSYSSSSAPNNQMFDLIMELPQFDDQMLGATVACVTDAPCILPLGGLYNFIMIIALILLGVGFLVGLASQSFGENKRNVVLDLVIGVLVILLFPLIYNNVARIVNFLDMSILAGPGNPYTSYTQPIDTVWSYLVGMQGLTFWDVLTAGILVIAKWLVGLIVYLMTIFLGIIRIWLVAIMVIAFPISMGLKLIPFTKKLSEMVEDTLYGLILASLMSSIVIGVAAVILTSNFNSSIFGGTGIVDIASWVAAAALFTAVLVPTVFAPLTGLVFQTAAQTTMAAVGTATVAGTMALGPAGMGMATGVQAGMGAMSALGSTATTGQKLAAGLKGFVPHFATGTAHGLQNLMVGATTGAVSMAGATQASKMIDRIAPMRPLGETQQVLTGVGQQQQASVALPRISTRLAQLMAGTDVDYSGLTIQGKAFEQTANWNPSSEAGQQIASKYRASWTNINKEQFKLESVRHGILSETEATNPYLVDQAYKLVTNKISSINPNSVEGAKALRNIKREIDARQFAKENESPLPW
jgi:hypothetical protein